LYHDVGSIVKVGSALLDIATGSASASAATTAAPAATTTSKAPEAVAQGTGRAGPSHKVLTTPSVRKIAKENKIDLTLVRATGPKGRILKEDVLNYLKNGGQTAPSSAPVASSSASTASESAAVSSAPASAGDVKVPIRGVQRLMVKSMNAANQVKHLTLGEEVTFDKMRVLRQQLKHAMSKQGVKLSYMPMIIKATSLALSQYPMLNATVNGDVTEVTHHHNHNIGIAMDTPKGLIVPVIKAVQDKSIAQIAMELNQLQEAALKGTITEAQLSGGTFSLSNIGKSLLSRFYSQALSYVVINHVDWFTGSVGGTYAVPVLVVPQVAIGALGRLQVVPRYVNKHGNPAKLEEIEE
jgi:2-oxoisovalerate dehydrogenase E2 component (dihydrolipoyl transacylase)